VEEEEDWYVLDTDHEDDLDTRTPLAPSRAEPNTGRTPSLPSSQREVEECSKSSQEVWHDCLVRVRYDEDSSKLHRIAMGRHIFLSCRRVPLDITREATKGPEVTAEHGAPSTWSVVSAW
jgi:hypothetical protein